MQKTLVAAALATLAAASATLVAAGAQAEPSRPEHRKDEPCLITQAVDHPAGPITATVRVEEAQDGSLYLRPIPPPKVYVFTD